MNRTNLACRPYILTFEHALFRYTVKALRHGIGTLQLERVPDLGHVKPVQPPVLEQHIVAQKQKAGRVKVHLMHSSHAVVMQIAFNDRPAVDQSKRVEELGVFQPKLGHVRVCLVATEDNVLKVACVGVLQQEDVIFERIMIEGDYKHDLVCLQQRR